MVALAWQRSNLGGHPLHVLHRSSSRFKRQRACGARASTANGLCRKLEVPLRECAAGAALQVPLEANGLLFGGELDDDNRGPGSVFKRVSARTVVVPFQTALNIARDAYVVAARVAIAANDVDEAPADTAHATSTAGAVPTHAGGRKPKTGRWRRTGCRCCPWRGSG